MLKNNLFSTFILLLMIHTNQCYKFLSNHSRALTKATQVHLVISSSILVIPLVSVRSTTAFALNS